jgi:hypothetical protein
MGEKDAGDSYGTVLERHMDGERETLTGTTHMQKPRQKPRWKSWQDRRGKPCAMVEPMAEQAGEALCDGRSHGRTGGGSLVRW